MSSRKCRPTLALHIGARTSSTLSSLFTVCRPERAMLGPAHAMNSFPVSHVPRTISINKLIYTDNYSKFSNNQALYRDPMPLTALYRDPMPLTVKILIPGVCVWDQNTLKRSGWSLPPARLGNQLAQYARCGGECCACTSGGPATVEPHSSINDTCIKDTICSLIITPVLRTPLY